MVPVSDLRSKLTIIVNFTAVGSRERLAAEFGLGERALRYWEGERPGTPPGIPDRHYGAFIELLRCRLPGNPSEADARRLLEGPPNDLKAALLATTDGNWSRYLAEHAD